MVLVNPEQFLFDAPSSSYFSPAPAWILSRNSALHDKTSPAWTLCRLQFLEEIPICPSVRSSIGCSMDICSSLVPSTGAGRYLLHHGLLHELLGNLCFNICNFLSSSFFSDHVVHRAVSLTQFLTDA